MQKFEKAIKTIKDSKNYLETLFNSTNIIILLNEDKLYLFNNVLPIVGKKEPFIQKQFFDIAKKYNSDFDWFDVWSKYQVITIDNIIEVVFEDENLTEDDIMDNVFVNELITLALKQKIYSFEIDW